MDPDRQQRINWFKENVRYLPFQGIPSENADPNESPKPVISRMNYKDIVPEIINGEDLKFVKSLDMAWYSLHALMLLPCWGLLRRNRVGVSTSDEKKRPASAFSSGAEYEGSYNTRTKRPNKMDDILHQVGKSESSRQMTVDDLNIGYDRFNELARDLDYDGLIHVFSSLMDVVNRKYYLNSYTSGTWEAQTRLAFQARVLHAIAVVFSERFPDTEYTLCEHIGTYTNLVNSNDMNTYKTTPDIVFSANEQPLVCFEVKYPTIKWNIETQFAPVLSQAVNQCICAKTRYGVITDYYRTMIFRIELEDEDIQQIRRETSRVQIGGSTVTLKRPKLVFAMVENDQSQDTLTAVVAQHMAMAHEEMMDDTRREITERGMENLARALSFSEEELNLRDQTTYTNFFSKFAVDELGQNGSEVFDQVWDRTDCAVLQEGRANSQVLRIGKSLFQDLTGKTTSEDSYVLKIFDPVHGKRNHGDFTYSIPSYINFTKTTALKEYEVYNALENIWGVHVPRLFHSGFCLLRFNGRIRFGGFFLVLQYLEGGPPNLRDRELQHSAELALQQIHAKGVAHGDVKLHNMIDHEGKVFMIDFGFSTSLIYTKGKKRAKKVASNPDRRSSQLMTRDDEKLRLSIQAAREPFHAQSSGI